MDNAENSNRSAEIRQLPGRPFPPGQSGNPGGRPRALADVRALARERTPVLIEALTNIALDPKEKGSTRVAATDLLLVFAWGKPLTRVEVSNTEEEDRELFVQTLREAAEKAHKAFGPPVKVIE